MTKGTTIILIFTGNAFQLRRKYHNGRLTGGSKQLFDKPPTVRNRLKSSIIPVMLTISRRKSAFWGKYDIFSGLLFGSGKELVGKGFIAGLQFCAPGIGEIRLAEA